MSTLIGSGDLEPDAYGNDQLNHHNDFVYLSDEGKRSAPDGFGTRIIAHQLEGARRLGVENIDTYGIGQYTAPGEVPHSNGYSTWPKMGFNGNLEPKHIAALPPQFRSARTTHELFRMPGGLNAWNRYGSDIDLNFDPNPNSVHSRLFAKYLQKKNIVP